MEGENCEDTTDSRGENKLERLDARMSQFDVRFAKLEETLHKFLTATKDKDSATPPAQCAGKRRRQSLSEGEGNSGEWDEPRSEPEQDEYTRTQGKQLRKKGKLSTAVHNSGMNSDSSSEGEICDDDDTLSLECQDDDLLKEIESDLDNKEKTADKVADSMAEIINKRFAQGLSDNKLKERLDKYFRPDNCPNLQVPKVNVEIWKDLPATVKQADVKLASVQRAIVKATAALAQSTQVILKAHTQKKLTDAAIKATVTDQNADAMALLGHACHELSMRRRYALRPHLPKHLTGLCNESVPITSQLFGDNLTASIKEIKELDKLSRGAGPSRYQSGYDNKYRNKPWQKGSVKDRRPFLGQRQQSYGHQKKNQGNKNVRQFYQRKA